ncbi:MAG: FeoC-like transcriptional regulator, partial [Gammaproteobacteria bacterium]
MILSDIKQYLIQRGSASLSDISVHFDADPNAVRGMLEQWIRKGKVSKQAAKAACGGG